MPVVGERQKKNIGSGYHRDPMAGLAATYLETVNNILTENGVDIFSNATSAFAMGSVQETMRNFFVENSVDRNAFASVEDYNDEVEMVEEMFINDMQAVKEYANLGSYNPVIGISFPMHKNILMNCIFDKGAIPKAVAKAPKFTITMETRKLITPEGEEIDMFTDQMAMTAAVDATVPFVNTKITLPEYGATDILATVGGRKGLDNLSIETYISAVYVKATVTEGEILPDGTKALKAGVQEVKIPTNLHFRPGYGDFERTLLETINIAVPNVIAPAGIPADKANTEILSAAMHKNEFTINASKGIIVAVDLTARKDTSNGMVDTCSVRWDSKTDLVEIPSAIPINTPISPEEVKDIGALYNMDQLTKVMSMMNLVLENYKDDKIRQNLDESYQKMDRRAKSFGVFDFAPSEGYALDFVEYRHATFMDVLDTHVTNMLEVLNDPNMTITVMGRPDLIRKITPTNYSYQSPSSMGPVELTFNKTVTTSDKRIYNFISSQKLKATNELTIILCPRNTQRIVYRIYDYQMYVSNEIRNAKMYTLPAIHAFQRWKFVEYQPVQGRLAILNPTGIRGENQPIMPLPKDQSLYNPDFGNKQNFGTDHATNAYMYNQTAARNSIPTFGTTAADQGYITQPIDAAGSSKASASIGLPNQPLNAAKASAAPATTGTPAASAQAPKSGK